MNRRLVVVTERDSGPITRMGEYMGLLCKAKMLSTFDNNFGYWQMEKKQQKY